MAKVRFIPNNAEVIVDDDESLLDAARKAGVSIDAPCGGKGNCGKCKVRIKTGHVKMTKNHNLDKSDIDQGYILACCSTADGDVTVEVLNNYNSYLNNMKIESLTDSRDMSILKRAKGQIAANGMKFDTSIRKDCIELPQPDLDDNISDLDRITRHVRKEMGYEIEKVSVSLLRRIPETVREKDFKVTLTHIPTEDKKTSIIDIEAGDTSDKLYGAAIDIGTTSVAALLVDLKRGGIVAKASSGNAQIKYGADVISRIIHSTRKDGLNELNKAVIDETINPLLKRMYSDSGIDSRNVSIVTASGNTVMTHLLLNVYTDYLRKEPYIPAFVKTSYVKAYELGIDVNPEALVYISPCVSSYVGGDITAGVLSSGMWASEEKILFIDLGTNGEIVYGNRDFMLSCACSAGPAFEGGEISCGMRASYGAIEKVKIDPKTLTPKLTVIGGGKPTGICGSGIIDIVAEMMLTGIIDRKGRINRDSSVQRVRVDEYGIGEYVIAFKDEYEIENDISIAEVDIDNFIRAKGAVFSGAFTLVSSLDMSLSDVDKFYIAGGIGSSIDIENSILIGLFPDIEKDKFTYIGNSSLMGSYLALTSSAAQHKLEEIASQITYMELSVNPAYMDEFVSACFLPHTDIQKFPSVKARLE